jgi:hypothetical protein
MTTMTEDHLLANVLELCELLHLRTAHFRPARTTRGWRTAVSGDGKGYPDVTIVGRRVLWRELKANRGRLSVEQIAWIGALTHAGADADVWRVADWRSGRIEAELREVA